MYHSQPLLHLGKNGGHVLLNKNLINSLKYVQFQNQIRSTERVTCPKCFRISPVYRQKHVAVKGNTLSPFFSGSDLAC